MRTKTGGAHDRIIKTASAISQTDVLASFALKAKQNNYTRPAVNHSDSITIKDGRHPVVELFLKDIPFVPNDTVLDASGDRTLVITGPNMAGKSTYMRQTALIVLMAQIGSFVPAADAQIGIADNIFTRVGASDNLAAGESTFMSEMNEVAYILRTATRRSLIILDEIGRGTSTYDGMSIARAVLEYVNDKKKLGARTLFATHYHELTCLENEMDGVVNYNVAAKKRGDDITFLRRIVRGPADGSYGIEVALLAGVPRSIVNRAKNILSEIEAGRTAQPAPAHKPSAQTDDQLSMLDSADSAVAQALRSIDPETLTPLEALTKIYELKKMADQ